jgi:hypothetical protein
VRVELAVAYGWLQERLTENVQTSSRLGVATEKGIEILDAIDAIPRALQAEEMAALPQAAQDGIL